MNIPRGYYVDHSTGIPTLLPLPGPKHRKGQLIRPPAQHAAPAPRPRKLRIEERIARSPLTTEAINEIVRTIEDPETWLPPDILRRWKAMGWIKEK
jgi:hypothetical protein